MRLLDDESVSLTIDEFGDPGAPPVLLIAGATQSMDWWEPDFCLHLAVEGLRIIRFDHRDTGQSTTWPVGEPGYTGVDLATDPLRILDALGLESAHLVGLSMGGGIAQYLGVHHASRVRSLALIESSPAGGASGELPPPDPAIGQAEAELPPVTDWADPREVVDYRVESARAYAGSVGFDEQRFRAIAAAEFARSRSMESSLTNHFLAADGTATDPAAIFAPTLVIHSASDPLFPLEHGQALARMIPNAALLRLESMGHETPPPQLWEEIVPAIADHVRREPYRTET